MTETDLAGSLREAVSAVLETMFFVEGEGPPEERPPETVIAASVDFEGSPSGTLSLRISEPAASRMAADFLGEEAAELPPARTLEVVSELANMICGSVLSRVESETAFRLSPPATTSEIAPVVQPVEAGIIYSAQLPGGALSVRFLHHGAGS